MLNKLKKYSLIFFLVFITGCFETPTEFVAPVWDVDISFPITNKTYTLEDAIENDTANFKWYDEGENYGLLYYSDSHKLDPVKVEDNLTIESFKANVTQKIETIKINEVEPVKANLRTDRVFPEIITGMPVIVPSYSTDLEVDFDEIDGFSEASFENGILEMLVTNQLPIDIELSQSEIRNSSDNSLISDYPDKVYIEAGNSKTILFNVAGSEILNSIELSSQIYTPGSGGEIVRAESDTALVLTASLTDLEIESVTAMLPKQDPVTDAGGFVFDETTAIASAEIKEGGFNLEITNDLSVGVNANLQINELHNKVGEKYSKVIFIPANEKYVLEENDLRGWNIHSDFPTKELTYVFEIGTEETDEPTTISLNDSIAVDVDFESMVFSSVNGKIKPTEIDIAETTFDLELDDFNNKFSYTNLVFDNPEIILNLECSADIDLLINGEIVAKNNNQTEVLKIENVMISSAQKTLVNLKDYGLEDILNSFSSDLPSSFIFRGSAIVNPENKYGSITWADSLVSSLDLEIPLNIGIADGEITDTVEIDLDNIDEEDIENINYAEIFFEIENAVPAGLEFSSEMYDSLGTLMLHLPTDYNGQTTMNVAAPSVDESGNVTEPGMTELSVKLFHEDVQKFFDSSEMVFHLKLLTPVSNGLLHPVKFKIDDNIKVNASVSAGYKVRF